MMEVDRQTTRQEEGRDSLSFTPRETTQNSTLSPAKPTSSKPHTTSPLPLPCCGGPGGPPGHPHLSALSSKVFYAVLPPPPPGRRPGSRPPGPGPPAKGPPAQGPSTRSLGQLHSELQDLREDLEHMKSQHNKEIKLLMNELDEEKRVRLTLQMELQRMKKQMSKLLDRK